LNVLRSLLFSGDAILGSNFQKGGDTGDYESISSNAGPGEGAAFYV
jgi:hypothetical protein